jgi:hypothetical protein
MALLIDFYGSPSDALCKQKAAKDIFVSLHGTVLYIKHQRKQVNYGRRKIIIWSPAALRC